MRKNNMLWSTNDVSIKDRRSYWMDAVCATYVQLECDRLDDGRFYGRIQSDQIESLTLSHVSAAPQRVCRTPAGIARSSDDCLLVSIQVLGTGLVNQDGRSAELRPGDFVLYDATRPYELRFDGDFEQYVLNVPAKLLRTRFAKVDSLTARAVRGSCGPGKLLYGLVESLEREVQNVPPGSHSALAASVENMLVAGLGTLTAEYTDVAEVRLNEIRMFVRSHLKDPLLSVKRIAKALNLSPSSIHRCFADEPESLAGSILAMRLDAAKRDLEDHGQIDRSITAIAFGWGFNDAAHFSRTFRDRFGQSPRSLRSAFNERHCPPGDQAAASYQAER